MTAIDRVRHHERVKARKHRLLLVGAVLCMAAVPLAVWLLAWPYNLMAGVPLGVLGLYLFTAMRA